MKNIDKIRGMSAEELGAFLGKAINQCSLCNYQDIPKCSGNCEKGITKWLNAKFEKPMPEIKAGDYIVYEKDGCLCRAVCVFGNIVYRIDRGGCCNYGGEMQEKTISIKRYDITSGTLEDIWRAKNEN